MNGIINGAAGKMGKLLIKEFSRVYPNGKIARVDPAFKGSEEGTDSMEKVTGKYDVIIDFSHHTSAPSLAEYAAKTHTPLVICTTGHTEEEKEAIARAAKSVPVFFAGNTSVGIAVLSDAVRRATAAMSGAEIEIVEIHHKEKKDAPSGTALMLAEAAREARPELFIKAGRSGEGAREKNEIGISSVRYGEVVGVHEVIVSTPTETLTFRHEAHDRSVFAVGAMQAAEYIVKKAAGTYSMKDVLADGE